MATAMKAKTSRTAPLPWTIRLPDGRTVFVEVPADMVRRDRDGSIGFSIAGARFLDRIRAMAMDMGDRPTPGHIVALREALDLTQAQLGQQVGVNKLTVSRWERGEISPSPAAVSKLQNLRRRAASKGTVIPVRFRSRGAKAV